MTDLRSRGDLLLDRDSEQRSDVGRRALAARHLVMPLLLLAALGGLYLYVGAQELDRIEARLLTGDVIVRRLREHVYVSAVATLFVILIAVPLGILVTRPFARRLTPVAVGLANGFQSIPSFGLLTILALILSIGTRTAIIALTAYAILPVLRNTMVGLEQVDRAMIEAGRGMGMTAWQVLGRIELPLAVPIIFAGVRISLILCVGTATLVGLIGAGGFGDLITTGIGLRRDLVILTGAVLTAVLALAIDWLAGVLEDVLRPRGL